MGKGEEGGCGGSVLPEAVLGFRQGKVEVEVGEDQPLQDFGGGAEE